MSLSLNPSSTLPPADDLVRDVDLATFMQDVIEASRTHLIVVDFWAPWCGPCKQLTPILEKLVRAAKGAVRLMKVDIDRNPQIAQEMGVQSIPAVFAFYQARPVDGFMGALPEAQIKAWIDKLIAATGVTAPADDGFNVASALKQAGEFLATKQIAMAQAVYSEIMEVEPTNAEGFAGFLRCLLIDNKLVEAKAALAGAAPDMAKNKALDSVRAAIELAEQGAAGADKLNEFEDKLAKNAADYQARYDLASALYAIGRKEEAIDHLLELIRRDRKWNEEAGRKQLVKYFEALGFTDPLSVQGRKRLSSILFS
jgi:putative thioredoxin